MEEQEAKPATPKDSATKKTLSENEIIGQCILFFVAGFETTATTISNCLYNLAVYPEIQERLHAELKSVLSGFDSNSEQYYETAMTKIPYLDAFVKETLRMCPPLARLQRRVSVDGYMLAGIRLSKDQEVSIAAYAVHHNPEYYPEPERFNPERFMPENKHLLVPYTYLPFGAGPRNCLGMRFAYQEIKLCLAKILIQFNFEPTESTPAKLQFRNFKPILNVQPFTLKVSRH